MLNLLRKAYLQIDFYNIKQICLIGEIKSHIVIEYEIIQGGYIDEYL
jgi:hypothetical protein